MNIGEIRFYEKIDGLSDENVFFYFVDTFFHVPFELASVARPRSNRQL